MEGWREGGRKRGRRGREGEERGREGGGGYREGVTCIYRKEKIYSVCN